MNDEGRQVWDAIQAYMAKRAARRTLEDYWPPIVRVVHPESPAAATASGATPPSGTTTPNEQETRRDGG